MNMVFDGFAGREFMSGDHFYVHRRLLAIAFSIPYHACRISHKPPGGIFYKNFFEKSEKNIPPRGFRSGLG
jgi:hypothetical protein